MGAMLNSVTETFERKKRIVDKYGEAVVVRQDKQGYTSLHYAESEQTAKFLIDVVSEAKRRDFLLTQNEDNETAIHTAAWWQQNSTIRYLMEFAAKQSIVNELLSVRNLWGKTALHRAGNGIVARYMIEVILNPKEKEKFICMINAYGKTGLHTACGNRKTGVVACLLSLTDVDIQKLLFIKNDWGDTALHNTDYGEIAKLLINAVCSSRRQAFISRINKKRETALHVACEEGRYDVVEVILSEHHEPGWLLLQIDSERNTALHKAANVAISKTLTSAAASVGVVEQLLTSTNKIGQTCIHIASSEGRLEIIKHLLSLENAHQNMFTSDLQGNTPLLIAIDRGHTNIVSLILEAHENNPVKVKMLMQHRNTQQQNAFHLGCRHIKYEKYYPIFREYIHMVDITDMSGPDIYGNTPLHYLAGTYNVAQFADHIMRLPLPQRRNYLLHTYNATQKSCRDVISKSNSESDINKTFLQSVLNTNANSLYEFYRQRITFSDLYTAQLYKTQSINLQFDPRLLKVMMYALNEYSLTSVACTSFIPQQRQQQQSITPVSCIMISSCVFCN